MAKNADDRYQTATELAVAARRALPGVTSAAPPPTAVTDTVDTSLPSDAGAATMQDAAWAANRIDEQRTQSDAVPYPPTPVPLCASRRATAVGS